MFNLDDPRRHQHAISVPFVTLYIIANVKESLKYQKLTCSCLARLAMHYTSTYYAVVVIVVVSIFCTHVYVISAYYC